MSIKKSKPAVKKSIKKSLIARKKAAVKKVVVSEPTNDEPTNDYYEKLDKKLIAEIENDHLPKLREIPANKCLAKTTTVYNRFDSKKFAKLSADACIIHNCIFSYEKILIALDPNSPYSKMFSTEDKVELKENLYQLYDRKLPVMKCLKELKVKFLKFKAYFRLVHTDAYYSLVD
jgi:hypothetical protein